MSCHCGCNRLPMINCTSCGVTMSLFCSSRPNTKTVLCFPCAMTQNKTTTFAVNRCCDKGGTLYYGKH